VVWFGTLTSRLIKLERPYCSGFNFVWHLNHRLTFPRKSVHNLSQTTPDAQESYSPTSAEPSL